MRSQGDTDVKGTMGRSPLALRGGRLEDRRRKRHFCSALVCGVQPLTSIFSESFCETGFALGFLLVSIGSRGLG